MKISGKYFIGSLLGLFLCLAACSESGQDTVVFAIKDKANLYNAKQEEQLQALEEHLYHRKSSQIMLYTDKNMPDINKPGYPQKLFNSFGIGERYINNGLLVVVAYNQKIIRLITGYGMEWQLPDSICSQIINHAVPSFKDSLYFEGTEGILKEIASYTAETDWEISYHSYDDISADKENAAGKIAILPLKQPFSKEMVLNNQFRKLYFSSPLGDSSVLRYSRTMASMIESLEKNNHYKAIVRINGAKQFDVSLLGIKPE